MAMQVRFQSQQQRDEELQRSDSRNAMLLREDARAIGATTALRTGGTRKPRTYTSGTECISYYLDSDGNKINARVFREPARNKRARALKNLPTNRKLTAADLAPIFAD